MSGNYKLEPHAMTYSKIIRRDVCSKCGLVHLNNRFTQWSVKMGCESDKHVQYEDMRKGK